jgi:adenylate kinase
VADTCDACGASGLVQREDDVESAIRVRLDAFHSQTAPLKSHYAEARLLRPIDGNRDPEIVATDIAKIVRKSDSKA